MKTTRTDAENAFEDQKRRQLLHEAKQLFDEAKATLVIRPRLDSLPPLSVDNYSQHLREYWDIHSPTPYTSPVRNYDLCIDETIRSKIFDLLRSGFSPFANDDGCIQSAALFILTGSFDKGFPLEKLLHQFLQIVIVRGVDAAVLTLDRCFANMPVSFQYVGVLEGIRLEKTMQVFEGVRLVPLSNSTVLPLENRATLSPKNVI